MTLDLFSPSQLSPGPAAPKPRPSIEARYQSFHLANPHVFDEMLRLARARLDAGERRIGAKDLWEALRRSLFTEAHEFHPRSNRPTYKLDNSLVALYSRAIIAAEPRLVGVIEIRKTKP